MFARTTFTTVSFVALSLLLSACVSDDAYAPVISAWQQPQAAQGFYRVRKGDTLYSIAWAFGLDYRTLVKINNLSAPYTINPGEQLRMSVAAKAPSTISRTPVKPVPYVPKQTISKPVKITHKPIKKQVKKSVFKTQLGLCVAGFTVGVACKRACC